MWVFTVFWAANLGRLLIVSKMTNMAAQLDLINAAIPVTIPVNYSNSCNYQ